MRRRKVRRASSSRGKDFAKHLSECQPDAYQRIGLFYNHSDEN